MTHFDALTVPMREQLLQHLQSVHGQRGHEGHINRLRRLVAATLPPVVCPLSDQRNVSSLLDEAIAVAEYGVVLAVLGVVRQGLVTARVVGSLFWRDEE